MQTQQPHRTPRRALMVFLIFAAAALFLLRGPWRALHTGGGDFVAPYVGTVRFINGVNPYPHSGFLELWHAKGASSKAYSDQSGERPVYPPSTFLMMAPLSALNWTTALTLNVLQSTILFGYLVYFFAKQIDNKWDSWPRTGFVVYSLGLSPVHAGIATGNVSIIACTLCMYSLLLDHYRKSLISGTSLAFALCIKPTVGIIALTYLVFCRRWKTVLVGVGLTFLIFTLSFLLTMRLPARWMIDYKDNVSFLFGPGGAADFASSDPIHFDMINLQVPFFEMSHNTIIANVLSWSTALLLGAIWFLLLKRYPTGRTRWAAPAALLLLGLLPSYQRNYNAGFILVALVWAFRNYDLVEAKWVMAISMLFLVPGEALIRKMGSRIPELITRNMLWNSVVIPQASWALVAVVLILLRVMARKQNKCELQPVQDQDLSISRVNDTDAGTSGTLLLCGPQLAAESSQ